GRLIVASNHSGQVPIDGLMIGCALMFEADPPRIPRAMIDYFAWQMPFVNVWFSRLGQVIGTPENCRRLLEMDETILVFPEGTNGIGQPFSKRYQVQKFGTGFMRLALETKTPIVPVAVIGCEEMAPGIGKIPLPPGFGAPYIPVTPTFPLLGPLGLIPYPAKIRLYFGEPMEFKGDANDEDVIVERKVRRVRSRLQSMINDGVKRREHVFW
ncbi:MAG: acyltransferase family protein, partial [Myxococcales bacterium]|nr:acyltransferase family protein [Myxococcales bacterium]